MINVNDQKIKEVMEEIHKAMLRKVKRGSVEKEDIIMENRLFAILCHDFDLEPVKCAIAMNETYGYNLTGNEVIEIFRSKRMSNPIEREELLQWADEVTEYFFGAITGEKEEFDKYEKKRKEPALKNGKKHSSQDRIAAIMIYEKYPEIDQFEDKNNLYLLGNTLAKYFFYDISDAISIVYSFPQYKDGNKRSSHSQIEELERKMSYEQAIQRVEQLENTLERTTTMLQDLQDEFGEQLQASKVKELAEFFARLNSEKYGCILDELLIVRKGVDKLRKSDYELPIEINGLLIMVKKLIQFVRDSHIEPIMKINEIKEVSASDVEFCNYEGSPFTTPQERKLVKVVSPGWIYKDKELQISRPKVKEEE